MAYKTNKSPIKQGWAGSIMGNIANQVQVPPPTASTNNGYLWGMGGAGTTPQTTQAAAIGAQQQPINSGSITRDMAGTASAVNPNIGGPGAGNFTNDLSRSTTPRPQAPINPKAFSNTKAIKGMYGKQNPGTFNRNVQGSGSPIMQMEDMAVLEDAPQMPPQGVQTNISPTYDLSNQ
jgi:hypothetical protein